MWILWAKIKARQLFGTLRIIIMEQNTVYRHMTTGNKFETNKFLVHGQRLNGSWQKLQIIALFCWLYHTNTTDQNYQLIFVVNFVFNST